MGCKVSKFDVLKFSNLFRPVRSLGVMSILKCYVKMKETHKDI